MNQIWNPPLRISTNNIDHKMRDANFYYGNCEDYAVLRIVMIFHKVGGRGNAQNPRGITVDMTIPLPLATIRGC
jgi:hypothetical protein